MLFCIIMTGCFNVAGTHGSLKGYHYATPKEKLEDAVNYVMKVNPNITHDTIGVKRRLSKTRAGKDTIVDEYYVDYYNDGKSYVSIAIKTGKGMCSYVFRYAGDEQDWKTSSTSDMFICYAYDEADKGGSEGNGGVDEKTLKYLTALFEKELVNNVDKQLKSVHTDDE